MRHWINLIEKHVDWPEDLLKALEEYQVYVDYDHVHGNERHVWQDRLIEFMRQHPHNVDGMLYRATVTWDDTAKDLLEKGSAVHKRVGSNLESWSKHIRGAAQYASGLEDQSAIIMAIPASSLKVVCDIDQVPLDAEHDKEMGEVLVLAEDRHITRSDVIAIIWCDYDDTGEHRFIGPDFDQEYDYNAFEKWLGNL